MELSRRTMILSGVDQRCTAGSTWDPTASSKVGQKGGEGVYPDGLDVTRVKPAVPSLGKPVPAVAVQEPTVKMSIYLEPSDDLYLEEIAHTGKTTRPRVAISRSAIVRLALEQLAKAMSTDEIVAELRTRGSQHQGRGRKRR